MSTTVQGKTSIPAWNRKLLNACWWFIFAITLGEIGNIFTNQIQHIMPLREFLIGSLLTPTILFLAVMAVTEWVYRRISASSPYLILVCGSLLTGMAVYVHAGNDSILSLYFMPLLVSVFYFNKRYVYQASLMNVASFLLIYFINPRLQDTTSVTDIFTTLMIIGVGGPYITVKIMDRGVDILRDLKIDALTGLYNHITFHEFMQEWLERGQQRQLQVMLAVIDVDHFKSVNDTYGHRAGDMVLRRAAGVIQGVVGQQDIAARYGGEEFALLLPERTREEAFILCEKVRTALAAAIHPELAGKSVTVSIGLTGLEPGMDKESWFQRADSLLYQAKRMGRNRTESVLAKPPESQAN